MQAKRRRQTRPYLRQCAATHGQVTVIADLQQCGPKAPLVCSAPKGGPVWHTLWGNPWDPLQALCIEDSQTIRYM